jgi:hypothetical protein
MKNMRAALGALLIAVAISGCNNSGANLVGSWKGQMSAQNSTTGSSPDASKVSGSASAMSNAITLDLHADHTFKITTTFPIEGNWQLSGSQITLTVTEMAGYSIDDLKKQELNTGVPAGSDNDRPFVFDVSSDGKILSLANGGSYGSLVLTKS